MTLTERIEEIDRMLFDAGVLILGAGTGDDLLDADSRVTDARVKLEQLRARIS